MGAALKATMPKQRHLKFAPIAEALFDIRVKARPDFIVSDFSRLKDQMGDRFPEVEERRGRKVTLQLPPKDASAPIVEDLGLQGFFFKSQNEDLIAQFRIDGFTLNKLKPYTSWEELLPIAMELWSKYHSIAKPDAVTRLALRYINHIAIESDFVDFDEYLRAAPRIPPELPQSVNAFFSRMTIVYPDRSTAAHVVQAFESNPENRGITIILDIDAFRQLDVSPNDPMLEAIFAELHDFKNRIFFNYLTEKTLGLFE